MVRYERKYRIEDATADEVRAVIRQNPGVFSTAYPDRYINSIYLDDSSFSALQENLAGISNRSKYRVRWYDSDLVNITNPTLEIKIKDNFTNTKKLIKLPDFKLTDNFDVVDFLNKTLPLPNRLFPVSLIRYYRNYYLSADRKVRATIDQQQTYYMYQGRLLMRQSPFQDSAIILEIKYEAKEDDDCDYIFQHIPFRLTKNSKYVNSIMSNYFF